MTRPERAARPHRVPVDERRKISRLTWTALILAIALAGAGIAAQRLGIPTGGASNSAAIDQTSGG